MELFANDIKIPYGGSLVLKFFNPLFNDIGGYSLPVTFNGKIPAIRKALNYPEKTEAEIKTNIPGSIKTKYLELVGSWNIVTGSEEEISSNFKACSGDFYSSIKDKTLNELDFGGVKYPIGVNTWGAMLYYLSGMIDVSYPNAEFACFCAYMQNATGTNTPDALKFVNKLAWNENRVPYISDVFGNSGIYLFAGTIIDYIFSNSGYRIEENIFRKDADLKQLVVFNTFNNCAPIWHEYGNVARIDYKNLVPHITISDFLKALRNRFNIGFFINEQQRSVRIKSFDSIITGKSKTQGLTIKGKTVENNRVTGLNFPLNAPDVWCNHSIISAVSELKDPIIVSKFRDILPATRHDGNLIYVQSETTYYRIKFTAPSTYEAVRICPDQFPYNAGDGSDAITQLSGIPAMYTFTGSERYDYYVEEQHFVNYASIDYIIPRCDLTGNRDGMPFTEFPLMFLFARGIADCYVVPDTQVPAYSYPIGTSDVYNALGVKISSANMALKWDGQYGLIAKFWANRINWMMNIIKRIKTEMLSDCISDMIDSDDIKRIKYNNYLVETFEIKITSKQARLRNVYLLRL
jgi:hypothetical protein